MCLCACIRVMDQVAAHLRSRRSFKADVHRCPHCNIILEIFPKAEEMQSFPLKLPTQAVSKSVD